jgi:tetratricopeptide (TPR) repeat protein
LRTSPQRLDLMRSLAVLLMDEGRYSEAAAQFEAIYASSKGTDATAAAMDLVRLSQAKALRDLSTASAKSLVDLFKTLSPEQQKEERPLIVATLLEARKPDLSLPLLEQEEATQGGKIPSKLKIERARALLLKGDSKGAQALVATLNPDATDDAQSTSDQLATLSKIAVANNNLSGADDLARKAVEKYPKNYDAYVQLGRVRLKEGKSKEAVDFAKKALDVNQYSTLAYLLMGDAQSANGSVKDAADNYRKAAELYPGLLEAHRALLESLRKLSLKDEAKREAEQLTQMEKQQ